MKISLLMAQFLYSQKRLDVPGMGSFYLDPDIVIDPDAAKNNKETLTGVRFEYNPALKDNPELTEFIARQTGKLKALASADLESHLLLGRQFLNIGKPFVLDGIGQLIKTQAGPLEFVPGILHPEILREIPARTVITETSHNEKEADYRDLLSRRRNTGNWKKPLAFVLVLAGIAVAIWGGYTIYKMTADTEENRQTSGTVPAADTQPVNNASVQGNTPADTARKQVALSADTLPVLSQPAGQYRFVVETATRQRAFQRYQKLKSLPSDIRMETADSLTFKLFYQLNVAAADTSRILDSLRTNYTPKWSRAYIEF